MNLKIVISGGTLKTSFFPLKTVRKSSNQQVKRMDACVKCKHRIIDKGCIKVSKIERKGLLLLNFYKIKKRWIFDRIFIVDRCFPWKLQSSVHLPSSLTWFCVNSSSSSLFENHFLFPTSKLVPLFFFLFKLHVSCNGFIHSLI